MLVLTPPMDWNFWNTFGLNITDEVVRETADKICELGLDKAGYQYIIVDDCWAEREREPKTGKMVADHEKFPHGMKDLGDYIH